MKKALIFIFVCGFLFIHGMAVLADGFPDLSSLLALIGETGISSFHLEDFSPDHIDFDMLLRIGGNSRINFSELNYDALLELLADPEVTAEVGVESVDMDELLVCLKDPATGIALNDMMLTARDGGSVTAAIRALAEDPVFLESFSKVTNGEDFQTVMENLSSGNASDFLEKAASALLSPKSGPASETARTLSMLVQGASDTLGWK